MKIAIIGSHGLNKTTLCHEVMAKLKLEGLNAGLMEETVRDCPFDVNENASMEAQMWIFHTQLAREIEYWSKYPILVCDRSVLDNYIYTVHLFGPQTYLDSLVREHMKSYDLVVWVPLWRVPRDDGFRSTDRQFQVAIHSLFGIYIPYFEVDPLPLCKDCRDSWSDTVTEEIKKRS